MARSALLFFATGCCAVLPKLPSKRAVFPRDPSSAGTVVIERTVFHDARRNRDVPVTMYRRRDARGALPVVIVSHGIGEDRDSYAYLGRAFAEEGFLAVHVTHAGTDRAMLRRGYLHLYRATKEKENWINRPLDVTFVLDQLARRSDADVERCAVVGHSAGAFTAFTLAGVPLKDGQRFRDARVKVIVPMSMPIVGDAIPAAGYAGLTVPALNVTGTCDSSIIYRTRQRDRRIPFEAAASPDQYLVTLEKVNHDTFSNATDKHQPLIASLAVAFVRAYLLHDEAARAWFDEPGTATVDGTRLSVERTGEVHAVTR